MQDVRSLYIHFPLCMHLCNYCDFYKKKLQTIDQVSEFEKLFLKQWTTHLEFLHANDRRMIELETLYIGGGTPSLWKTRGAIFMQDLMAKNKINFTTDHEYTIEVDPGTCSNEDLDAWIETGVNRFSVGVQAYSNTLLKLMDRQHLTSDVDNLLKYLGENSLNFSVDLMIGLPSDQPRDIESEISALIDHGAKHFSVYILKTRKNYVHASDMPEDDLVRREYLFVCELLANRGFEQYEISNFAKPGFESKHNKKYWDYSEVAAIGPNSTGLLVVDEIAKRYQWKSLSDGYQVEEISGESLVIEKLFLGLRRTDGINLTELFPSNSDLEKIEALKANWATQGYLIQENSAPGIVRLAPLGYLMCDSVIDDIFKQISF